MGSRGKKAEKGRGSGGGGGGSGAAELSCQLCEKLRFMRVARGVGAGACRQVTAKSCKTHIKY